MLILLEKLPIHKSMDYYVPNEPMIIHDSIMESITYCLQQPTRKCYGKTSFKTMW